jgi:transcriptional regulator with XRE-family HTH domain
MQEIISLFPDPQNSGVYTGAMADKEKSLQKEPSEFGKRIAEARLRAGLTQVELSKRLGVTQQVVAAWERRNVALRAEQIRTLAEALGTTADYLIGIAANWKGTKGPSGKVRQVFEQVSKLPRRQQEKVVEFVEAFVQHKAAAG